MSLQATIKDHVTYRPGDGAPIEIPPGPVEIDRDARQTSPFRAQRIARTP